jgi:hypothetical protein
MRLREFQGTRQARGGTFPLPVLPRNASGSPDAAAVHLIVLSPLVHAPALRGSDDGECCRTRTGLGGPAGGCHRGAGAVLTSALGLCL